MKLYSRGIWLFIVFLYIAITSVTIVPADRTKDEIVNFWVKETLGEDPRIDDSKIKVSTQAGIVTLNGQVPNLSSPFVAAMGAVTSKVVWWVAIFKEIPIPRYRFWTSVG
jgi:hypothetical protein